MRKNIKDFVSLVSRTLVVREPIYEFGAFQVSGQEGFADLRSLFPGKEYVGADIRQGPGVDRLINLHDIELPDESVGTVLCLDTLEHVEYPHRALNEIHRILKPDGIVVLSSVMYHPIHDYPNDFWRFTPEALRSLLKPFAKCFVGFAGKDDFPHTVIGIGYKGEVPDVDAFLFQYDRWRKKQDCLGVKRVVRLVLPPFLMPVLILLYMKIKALFRTIRQEST